MKNKILILCALILSMQFFVFIITVEAQSTMVEFEKSTTDLLKGQAKINVDVKGLPDKLIAAQIGLTFTTTGNVQFKGVTINNDVLPNYKFFSQTKVDEANSTHKISLIIAPDMDEGSTVKPQDGSWFSLMFEGDTGGTVNVSLDVTATSNGKTYTTFEVGENTTIAIDKSVSSGNIGVASEGISTTDANVNLDLGYNMVLSDLGIDVKIVNLKSKQSFTGKLEKSTGTKYTMKLSNIPQGEYEVTAKGKGFVNIPFTAMITSSSSDVLIDRTNLIPGDAYDDGTINLADFNLLHSGVKDIQYGDYNRDGQINKEDIRIMIDSWQIFKEER